MAAAPDNSAFGRSLRVKAPDADPDAELVREIKRRVGRAEQDFSRHRGRIQDCYRFAMPWRHKINATQPSDNLDDLYDSTAMTVLEDFAADMLNTFTPQKNDWVTFKPAANLKAADARQIEAPLKDYQRIVFAEMARSNLYQAFQEAYMDLGPGTMALLIVDKNPAEPIHCQAIPITELRIDRGPYGGVDGRWWVWKCRAEDVPTLWPKAKAKIDALNLQFKPGDATEVDVIDGVYRDWSDLGNETWQYVVLARDRLILRDTYMGRGSCPIPVARWSRDSTTAWGVGPTYRSLPDIKTANHICFLQLKVLDKNADPATSYEDDGVINLDQGVVPGTWVPRAHGSDPPTVIEPKGEFQLAIGTLEDMRSSIKRAHYQDRPEQLGKTPPSATQWADERAERARRMGTPATNLVQELQYPVVQRFAYLLEKRGVLPKIELNGENVALEPISPLLRAQEQEEVVRLDRFAEMIGARFGPQIAIVVIDLIKYADRLAQLLGVDASLLRAEADIADAIQKLMPVLQHFVAGQGVPTSPVAGAINPALVPGQSGAA
jgi:head-to-tail connecting protein